MTCASFPQLLRVVVCSLAAGWMGQFSGCAWTGMFESRSSVIFPEDEELALGQKAFDQAILTRTPSQNAEYRQMVEQVGNRLAKASERAGWPWKFVLVGGDKPEAVCLPGGKMIVSEGMVARCGNEAGLAAVMSHEIAHVIAHHGNQRMAEQVARSGRSWLKPWKRGDTPEAKQEMIEVSYGLSSGGNVGDPFNSIHEAEADSIGLKIMAKAGYDPREAPKVWERLARADRQNRPEFAHLHPADEERTRKITKLMPTALAYYAQSPQLGVGLAIATPPVETPKRGVTLASHTQAGDPSENRTATGQKTSNEETKAADKPRDKLVRTADGAVPSNDPFLGSPKPVVATTAAPVTQVPLHPVEEPPAKSTRFAAYAPERESAPGEAASPAPKPATETTAAAARPSEPQLVPTSRWAKPIPVSTDGPPRVPRPTIDLSEAPMPDQDDNWRTAREPRANPFAGR